MEFFANWVDKPLLHGILLPLTVGKIKNRCKPYGYGVTAIFAVVANYGNFELYELDLPGTLEIGKSR